MSRATLFAASLLALAISALRWGLPTRFEGSIGPVAYDSASHLFRVPVTAGTGGSANIRIATSPRGTKPPKR